MAATCEELYDEAARRLETAGGGDHLPPAAPYSGRVLREVAADAVRKGVCRLHSGATPPDLTELHHQASGRDVYGGSDSGRYSAGCLIPLSKKSESLHNTVNMLLKCIFYCGRAEPDCWSTIRVRGYSAKRRETDPKERFADRPAGGRASGYRQRTSAVSVYHDRLICRSAPRRSSRTCNGIVCSWTTTLHISLCGAHGVSEHNRPVVSTTLKTKAARRDIPIPKCLGELSAGSEGCLQIGICDCR